MSANGKTKDLTPQQAQFWIYYNDPKSESFSNAYKSALRAKYSPTYARNIKSQLPEWICEIIDNNFRKALLSKAEKVLNESLDYKEKYIKTDVAKFIARTQGKHKGYSERIEHTGTDGKDLTINITSYKSNTSPKP